MHERILAGLAAGLLLCGGIWTAAAQDLDARKTPQQLFSANCAACHRSPQGLMKSNSASGVAGFLRQHYTSGPASASALAGYLAAAGPGDPRTVRPRAEPAARPPEAGARQGLETAAGPDPRSERYRQRAARNAERLERAARAEAAERRAAEPAGLSPSRPIPRRPAGEPAVVSIDPPSILISTDPKPVTPRVAARTPVVAPAATAIAPAAPSTPTITAAPPAAMPLPAAMPPPQPPDSTTAALPAPSAPASDAEAPGVSAPPSAVAAGAEPAAADDLPPYPPPPLEFGAAEGVPAETPPAAAAADRNGAQPGFSAPLP